jgi:hypothetical protein
MIHCPELDGNQKFINFGCLRTTEQQDHTGTPALTSMYSQFTSDCAMASCAPRNTSMLLQLEKWRIKWICTTQRLCANDKL